MGAYSEDHMGAYGDKKLLHVCRKCAVFSIIPGVPGFLGCQDTDIELNFQDTSIEHVVFQDQGSALISSTYPWFIASAAPRHFVYPPISSCYNMFYNSTVPIFQAHFALLNCRKSNFSGCRFPVCSHFDLNLWGELLVAYHDNVIVDLLRFGWPINFTKGALP